MVGRYLAPMSFSKCEKVNFFKSEVVYDKNGSLGFISEKIEK